MRVSELRVGNWIEDWTDIKNGSIQRQIDLDDFAMMANYERSGDHPLPFKPIPLTEEICCKIKIGKEDVSLSKTIGVDLFYFVIGNYYKRVYFLHEVQNLYFDLFGEELEVKL